jgi:hypothetical protein
VKVRLPDYLPTLAVSLANQQDPFKLSFSGDKSSIQVWLVIGGCKLA